MQQGIRHFLDIADFDRAQLRYLLSHARMIRNKLQDGELYTPLKGKTLAQIYEKPSTRTRISFDVGMRQLGGEVITLSADEMQLGRGETIADTSRVLNRYVDIMVLRTDSHKKLLELAEFSFKPVINGLSDLSHPCQIMADVLTIEDHKDSIQELKIVWLGEFNNVLNSWIQIASKFDFQLIISTPEQLAPPMVEIEYAIKNGAKILLDKNPAQAVKDADVVITDTWFSMGDKQADEKRELLQPYQVNTDLFSKAKSDAIFMHCLPAHRGEEVTNEVIDSKQSVVFDEAENRLHAQKAILNWCVNGEIF